MPTNIKCAGDTASQSGSAGGGCEQMCNVAELLVSNNLVSNQVVCTKKDGTEYEQDVAKLRIGESCTIQCTSPKVVHPRYGTSTCQKNSEWSNPLRCSALCPYNVLSTGVLKRGSEAPRIESMDNWFTCADSAGIVNNVPSNMYTGVKCTAVMPRCRTMSDGIKFFTKIKQLYCGTEGVWKRNDGVTVADPVCQAELCRSIVLPTHAQSVVYQDGALRYGGIFIFYEKCLKVRQKLGTRNFFENLKIDDSWTL